MSTTPHKLPRFIPTLTEVVLASSLPDVSTPASTNTEELVQSVMQQMKALLERRISEEIETLVRIQVEEQMQRWHVRLHQELMSVVPQAVADALAFQSEALKKK